MNDPETPNWLYPGATVALRFLPSPGQREKVEFTGVEKIGKRDVVLSNGQRINVSRLSKSRGDVLPPIYLCAPDDPSVVISHRKQSVANVAVDIINVMLEARAEDDEGKVEELLLVAHRYLAQAIEINEERKNPPIGNFHSMRGH